MSISPQEAVIRDFIFKTYEQAAALIAKKYPGFSIVLDDCEIPCVKNSDGIFVCRLESSMDRQIQVGDIVELRSIRHTPRLTVNAIDDHKGSKFAECVYYHEGVFLREKFDVRALRLLLRE